MYKNSIYSFDSSLLLFQIISLIILTWTLGGPYGLFAGRDASRALATFSMTDDVFRNEYDDLSDLSSMQMESVREWEMQFTGEMYGIGKIK